MQQLSGLDTTFLNIETPTTYGHVSGLAIFDPSTSPTPPTLDDTRALITERIHLLPPYRRRLIRKKPAMKSSTVKIRKIAPNVEQVS